MGVRNGQAARPSPQRARLHAEGELAAPTRAFAARAHIRAAPHAAARPGPEGGPFAEKAHSKPTALGRLWSTRHTTAPSRAVAAGLCAGARQ
eukprot:365603-Chlamydomonas_euryale.AAC.15